LISAFKDRRFNPIAIQEVEDLTVTITYLKNFEKAKDAYDWIIGTHGITIDFNIEGQNHGATYLP